MSNIYTITLTRDERRALDFIAGRYDTGDIASVLIRADWGNADDWSDTGDITFTLEEHEVWEIDRLCGLDDWTFPCLAPTLADKLLDLCLQIC